MSLNTRYRFFVSMLMLLLAASTGVFAKVADDADTAALKGLEWRLIGPFRGGRVTTVTGVVGKPLLYYMGATGGGVWKT